MTKKYTDAVKKLKYIQLILIVLCLIIASVYIYFITKPKISKYEVNDECGPIGGSISHTIDDIDSCDNACLAHCQSFKKNFYNSEFIEKEGPDCNLCSCYCKE